MAKHRKAKRIRKKAMRLVMDSTWKGPQAERRRTHEAATTRAEEGARLALKAAEHSVKLKEDALKEQQELAKQKRLTFQQKEKRKRDSGMQSRGKSTVEEEKRIGRQYGMYSGFD
eukprot:gene3201-3478_t